MKNNSLLTNVDNLLEIEAKEYWLIKNFKNISNFNDFLFNEEIPDRIYISFKSSSEQQQSNNRFINLL